MTHFKHITTIAFLIISFKCIGQSKVPTTKNLRHTFQNIYTTNKKEKRKYSTWFACNLDSSFYKSDTVYLTNDQAYHLKNNCCKLVQLSFYSRVKCFLNLSQLCKPGVGSVTVATSKDLYKLKFEGEGEFAFLLLLQSSGLQIKFKALTIDNLIDPIGDKYTVIRLVRVY